MLQKKIGVSLFVVLQTSFGFLFKNNTLKHYGFYDVENIKDGDYFTKQFGRSKSEPIHDGKKPPSSYDWRKQDAYYTPVVDQRDCDAGWAYSMIASIEAHSSIYLDKRVQLAPKYLIDCLPDKPGCDYYSMESAYNDIISELNGVLPLDDYKCNKCSYEKPSLIKLKGFKKVASDEDEMLKALYVYGPLSAEINPATMKVYKGNYIDEPTEDECSRDESKATHAVLIVGYHTYKDTSCDGREVPYWIIKNSKGKDWGHKGYYYMRRGTNACGITTKVTLPFVD